LHIILYYLILSYIILYYLILRTACVLMEMKESTVCMKNSGSGFSRLILMLPGMRPQLTCLFISPRTCNVEFCIWRAIPVFNEPLYIVFEWCWHRLPTDAELSLWVQQWDEDTCQLSYERMSVVLSLIVIYCRSESVESSILLLVDVRRLVFQCWALLMLNSL
jgi:hypothetical protein